MKEGNRWQRKVKYLDFGNERRKIVQICSNENKYNGKEVRSLLGLYSSAPLCLPESKKSKKKEC